jgi:arylsulfatase A-like enzyme/Tfp pilus assembly protein PilF
VKRPAALALAAILSVSAAPPAPSVPSKATPSILLVTIDTLRPDALGWVAGRNSTPAIDRMAREGLRFRTAVSPVPLTGPAHASLLTGLLPRRHGVRDNGQMLGPEIPTVAAQLRRRGYATAAFVSGYPLQRFLGLDRGFDVYDDTLPHGSEGWLERKAGETTDAALAWLRTARRPFFAWVHYYDPHDPYDPPRVFWKPGPRGAYDGEVAFVDDSVGRLREGLGALADGGDLLWILTADHGEGLGDHREKTHGYFVYDSTVAVPLVFRWPGRISPAERDLPVRLIDIAPTVVDLAGAPRLDGPDGISLVPLLEGQPQEVPAALIETRLPWIYFGWSPLKAVRDGRFKLIDAPRPELFDLQQDPGETSSLDARARPEANRLRQEMDRIERRPPAAASRTADPEILERLRALGYVGAGGGEAEPPENLPDPKDRIGDRDRLTEAEQLLRGGNAEAALRIFDDVLAREPENRAATLRSGVALLKLGRVDPAIQRLERSVRLDPARAEARFALGDALMRKGRFHDAAAQWAEMARLQPGRFEAWANLGTALLNDARQAEAAEALRRALALRPDDPVTRARHAAASGRTAEARAILAAAVSQRPDLRAALARDAILGPLLP